MVDQQDQQPDGIQVAMELGRCRQRGLDAIDFQTHNQAVLEVPELERLAQTYAAAHCLPVAGRAAAIRRLLTDALTAYAARGDTTESQFIRRLFFDPLERVPKVRPGDLLREAKVDSNIFPDNRFRDFRHAAMRLFADFLGEFVTTAQIEHAPPAPVLPEADATARDEQEITFTTVVYEAPVLLPPLVVARPPEPPAPSPLPVQFGLFRRMDRRMAGVAIVLAVVVVLAVLLYHTLGRTGISSPTHRLASPAPGSYQPGHTRPEIAGEYGSPTFTDPHSPSTMGARIEPYQQIQVSCKVFAPTIPSISPDGYWYRVASPKWGDKYYTPATNFLNGDSVTGERRHYTDFVVPDCPSQ